MVVVSGMRGRRGVTRPNIDSWDIDGRCITALSLTCYNGFDVNPPILLCHTSLLSTYIFNVHKITQE